MTKAEGTDIRLAAAVGKYAAVLTAVLTIVTFAVAFTAVPISGTFCLKDCVDYPYTDTAGQYPHDYLWMPLAMLLTLAYVLLMACIHAVSDERKRIFSRLGLGLALMAAVVLLIDYYVQFTVLPVSLIRGETEGVALWTQFNPNGMFIALEELGFLLMTLSFLCVSFVFAKSAALRWVFLLAAALTFLSLAATGVTRWLERGYQFEIMAISINWLALAISGILLVRWFGRKARAV